MKILSIIAQKANSTGSGVYLSEIVRCLQKNGYEQEVICASYENDKEEVKNNILIKYNKVFFDTQKLPMKIAGMSDVMPYESIKYSDLAKNEALLYKWETAFSDTYVDVINRFKPDLIICHHLYLLTAMVVNYVKENNIKCRIYGICHNTDLRQYQKTDLKRSFIKENIKKLDRIFAPSEEHKKKIVELYNIEECKIEVIGIGYNKDIFYMDDSLKNKKYKVHKLLYVGKVAKKKGVLSLVKSLQLVNHKDIVLDIIGGAGDKKEYDEILDEVKKIDCKINIIGSMNQIELAKQYNMHDIFILPSFSEGIPMVPIEAMACGCKLVISNLPCVKNFYDKNIKDATIKYVKLPSLSNVDDANDIELALYEERLAKAIDECIDDKRMHLPKLQNLSWENIVESIISKYWV